MKDIACWTEQHPCVEAWSEHRLPFEPKGDMLDFRNRLRNELRAIPVTVDGALIAEYRAQNTDACDVENILFYNVGSQPFTRLRVRQLAFKRVDAAPPLREGYEVARHYMSYRLGPAIPDEDWGAPATQFESAPLSPAKLGWPWHAWLAMKQRPTAPAEALPACSEFRLRVDVKAPDPDSVNLFGILKGMLDGVIAALQPASEPEDKLVAALAARLCIEPQEVRRLLLSPSGVAIGPEYPILRGLGPGRIQINPADHLLTSATITLSASSDDQAHISGSLFSAQRYPTRRHVYAP